MIISMIAAIGKNRELGFENKLLWRLPADMKHFRLTTMGKPIIMGRKTYESFGAKPLPGRRNIIVTHNAEYSTQGADVVFSIDQALSLVKDADEVMIIGGANFYEQMLVKANRLYLTYVDGSFEADTWFPEINQSQWIEKNRESHVADEKNSFNYDFVVLDRIE